VKRPASAIFTFAALGCGSTSPLMHPAHPLPQGRTAFGAGISNTFLVGEADEALEQARAPDASSDRAAFLEGVAAHVAVSPGLAPWVGARAGLGAGFEAGIGYTGRSARLDARYAVPLSERVAVSAGAGARGILVSSDDEALPGVDASRVNGLGVDIPLIVGWRSDAEVILVWGGARGGGEWLGGDLTLRSGPDSEEQVSIDANRFYVGGLVGIAAGVHPVWVAVELEVGYQTLSSTLGEPDESRIELDGTTIAPTGALLVRF
jgi:hypothetical protein